MRNRYVFIVPSATKHHEQRELEEMNRLGEYVTDFEGRGRHKSFQFGWAAGFRSRTFMAVAEERMKLAENDDYVQQLSFDNNIRGLPHQNRRKKAASNKILEGHCVDKLIDPDELSATFLISDTQDTSSPWVLLGVDAKANIHVLDHGIEELLVGYEEDEFGRPAGLYHDHWNRFYGDYKPTLMLIDEGGTRTSEVCALVQYDDSGESSLTRATVDVLIMKRMWMKRMNFYFLVESISLDRIRIHGGFWQIRIGIMISCFISCMQWKIAVAITFTLSQVISVMISSLSRSWRSDRQRTHQMRRFQSGMPGLMMNGVMTTLTV